MLMFIFLDDLLTDVRARGKTQVDFWPVMAVHCSGFTQSFVDHSRGPDYLE